MQPYASSQYTRVQVLLAIDGSGPMAKMATQQSRRRKTSAKAAAAAAGTRGLSPLLLTPGTQFMERLEEALVYWIYSELSTHRGRHLRILLSGSDAPGEATRSRCCCPSSAVPQLASCASSGRARRLWGSSALPE